MSSFSAEHFGMPLNPPSPPSELAITQVTHEEIVHVPRVVYQHRHHHAEVEQATVSVRSRGPAVGTGKGASEMRWGGLGVGLLDGFGVRSSSFRCLRSFFGRKKVSTSCSVCKSCQTRALSGGRIHLVLKEQLDLVHQEHQIHHIYQDLPTGGFWALLDL